MPRPPQKPLDLARLEAVTGGERINGTHGNDTIQGGSDNDTIQAFGGNDHVAGGGGRDMINGGDGDDIVVGGDGADTISGGWGSNVIIGGLGADELHGGPGNDEFRWHPGDGNDTINGGAANGSGPDADVLVIEDSGLSLQGLFDGLKLLSGRMPQMMDGYIDVTGFNGTLTIGGETIRFNGLEKLVLGSYSFVPGR